MLVCASKRPASTACFNSRAVGRVGGQGAEGANTPTQILAGIEINLLIHGAGLLLPPPDLWTFLRPCIVMRGWQMADELCSRGQLVAQNTKLLSFKRQCIVQLVTTSSRCWRRAAMAAFSYRDAGTYYNFLTGSTENIEFSI